MNAIFWVLAIVVAIVALIIINSKGQAPVHAQAQTRGRDNSGIQVKQVANSLRIMLESAKIINKTTKYDVKLSRSNLMWDVFKQLNDYNGSHLIKNEEWFRTIQVFEKYVNDLGDIDSRRFQAMNELKTSRSNYTCPYCMEHTFQEGSRAVKCKGCGKKASRLKISKNESLMVLPEELEKILSIEEEALDLSPDNPTNAFTVSPQVVSEIKQMEEKLSRMSG